MDRASGARGEIAAMEYRTLASLNAAHEADEAAGDFLATTFAKAASRSGRQGAEEALYRLRPSRAKALVPAMLVDDAPDARGPQAYAALVRRRALLGRIPGARPAPPLVRLNSVSDGTVATFITEGQPIPVSSLTFATPVMLRPSRVAGIVPFSDELLRSADPAALNIVSSDLTRALAVALDTALLDGQPAVTEGRAASILWGVSSTGGGSPADIEADLVELVKTVRAGEAESPAFIVSMTGALYLATLRASSGDRLFPDVTLTGGTVLGVPLLISPAAGAKLVLLDGALLVFADSGVEAERSSEAALQFSDAPTAGAANVVSLWQANTTALRTTQYVTWALGGTNGVGYVDLPLGSPVV